VVKSDDKMLAPCTLRVKSVGPLVGGAITKLLLAFSCARIVAEAGLREAVRRWASDAWRRSRESISIDFIAKRSEAHCLLACCERDSGNSAVDGCIASPKMVMRLNGRRTSRRTWSVQCGLL
jgi:hypothetical protein